MVLETLLSLNPEFVRRREIELDNQPADNASIEISYDSNCLTTRIFTVSDVDNVEKSIKNEIYEISELENNWNGYGTSEIHFEVINNALNIVRLLRPTVLCHLHPENVYPSKFGTIIMDWDFGKDNLFSLEIAKQSVGYFTEVNGEPDIQIDRIDFDYDNNNGAIMHSIHHDIAKFIQ